MDGVKLSCADQSWASPSVLKCYFDFVQLVLCDLTGILGLFWGAFLSSRISILSAPLTMFDRSLGTRSCRQNGIPHPAPVCVTDCYPCAG